MGKNFTKEYMTKCLFVYLVLTPGPRHTSYSRYPPRY